MSNPRAAAIIIGDEILSGRTLDTNSQYLAKSLTSMGIDLCEVRTIEDDSDAIIKAARELKEKYDYVFTSGGIGPTHDDITSISIAKALNLPYERNNQAFQIITDLYKKRDQKINKAREKMSYMPSGSKLIIYSEEGVPGFKVDNIYVLAGIPNIFKAMLDSVISSFVPGKIMKTLTKEVMVGESVIAEEFLKLQKKYPKI